MILYNTLNRIAKKVTFNLKYRKVYVEMKATQFFTDQNHDMSRVEVFPALRVLRANTLHISEQSVEGFQGCGVAITGASCYNLSLMKTEERQELLEKIYTKKGLDLSIARLTIGSSDYSAELYSYDDVEFDTELSHFSIAHDEKYVIPIIKQILEIKPELYLFASPWSPPGWMKTGGNICGGYMREEFIECYADYFVKYIKAYEKEGIHISAITPQNEPNTQQDGYMTACIWHPEIEAKFVKILKQKFVENQIDTEIWIYDHTFSDADRVLWQLDNTEGLADACDGIAFHYYKGTIEETLKLKAAYPKLPLHFTEAGPRLYDNYDTDWCKWGTMISKAIECGYKSFTGWNLMLNETGGPNIGPFLCGGMITRNNDTGELEFSGQYKAFHHISPHLKPESKLYPIYVDEAYDLPMYSYPQRNMEIEGFCIDNQDEKILILMNPNSTKRQVQFYLNNTWWYLELTPESISTIFVK